MFFSHWYEIWQDSFFFYRQKLNNEYSQQFLSVLQQWELDMQRFEEQGEKLTVSITIDFIITLL